MFYCFQPGIQNLLDTNNEGNFVFTDGKPKRRAKHCKNRWNLILEATFSVALLQIIRCVVCHETRAACSNETCDLTAVFDGGFAYNGNHPAEVSKTVVSVRPDLLATDGASPHAQVALWSSNVSVSCGTQPLAEMPTPPCSLRAI